MQLALLVAVVVAVVVLAVPRMAGRPLVVVVVLLVVVGIMLEAGTRPVPPVVPRAKLSSKTITVLVPSFGCVRSFG